MILFGINSVREALRAGRVRRMRVGSRADDRIRELLDLAAQAGIPVERVDAVILDRESRGAIHQGVVAQIDERREASLADLASTDHGPPLIVVLDGIEDPHNVGAILRTVDAVGAGGLVRQERRAAPLDAAAAKTSAGAVAWVTVVDVVNIARALEELKTRGVWTVGLDADASQSYDTVDFTLPTAVVLGAEGTGLRRLVRERCDVLASIPMAGHVGSLNVSVAAGVVLFEAARQRRGRQPR
jgi:23S rRNA (guanosine2251-2'-O)-methyltransferase